MAVWRGGGGGAGISAPHVIRDPNYPFMFAPHKRLLVFVCLAASSKDVVGEIACCPFDTTPFLFGEQQSTSVSTGSNLLVHELQKLSSAAKGNKKVKKTY